MKANPLQDKSWWSPELVVQTRQERETKLSFTYEWTFSSYSMAASERLKTSRKAVTGTEKQLGFFFFAWPMSTDLVDKWIKKQKQITLKSGHTVPYLIVRGTSTYWRRELSVIALQPLLVLRLTIWFYFQQRGRFEPIQTVFLRHELDVHVTRGLKAIHALHLCQPHIPWL